MDSPALHKSTLVISCVQNCIKCRAMDKAVTKGFHVWADDMGFNVDYAIGERSASRLWREHGKALGLTHAMPQIYIVNGEDIKGVTVTVGKVVGNYRIPPVERWDTTMLKTLVRALKEENKR